MVRSGFFVLTLLLCACRSPKPAENPSAWKKIELNFKKIDTEGLRGGAKGKVAVDYEFCIPADPKAWKKVRSIDPSAKQVKGRGRVGCKENQWLVIGNTHQENYQRVLYELASLPYVARIVETVWE